MKLQQLQNKALILTIPSQIARAKGWKKGDEIETTIDKNGDLVLKKK